MTEQDPYEIRVLRAASCPDDETCFVIGSVPARPGLIQAVARTVTDPKLIAAYKHKIGQDEVLVEFDRADILGVTDA